MKTLKKSTYLFWLIAIFSTIISQSQAANSVFTYQGRLTDKGNPALGEYDFDFSLYGSELNGAKLGNDISIDNLMVMDGYFTVNLDFGSTLFTGDDRWLQIAVRPGNLEDPNDYTILAPRQKITSSPYAINADTLDGLHADDLISANNNSDRLIRYFIVAVNETVTAGDVVVLCDNVIKKGSGESAGSEYIFNNNETGDISVKVMSDSKFIVAFQDIGNNNYGTVRVGEIYGESISFGPEIIFNNSGTTSITVLRLSDTKFVITYRDGTNDYGCSIFGDVSGNSVNFGSEYIFNNAMTGDMSSCALSDTKFVVAYEDEGNNRYGTARIGEISGNSINYGTEYMFNTRTYDPEVNKLTETKIVISFTDSDDNSKGKALISNISGTTITFGSKYTFNAAGTWFIKTTALSSTDYAISFIDDDDDIRRYDNTLISGTISGNTITFGSKVTIKYSSDSWDDSSIASISTSKFLIAYTSKNYWGVMRECGTLVNNISIGSELYYNKGWTSPTYDNVNGISIDIISERIFVISYIDGDDSRYGTAFLGNLSGVPIGIADADGSGEQVIPVIIHGVSNKHSGLVPGLFYYAQTDGSLTLETTLTKAGIAISTTELLLTLIR